MSQREFSILHVTRRIYPTFRVDLTELFSNQLIGKGHRIDWMMQSIKPHRASEIKINNNEKVYLCTSLAGSGPIIRLLNKILGLIHDVRILSVSRKTDYDAIQIRDKTFASLVGLLAAKLNKSQLFYWMSYPYVEGDALSSKEKIGAGKYPQAIFFWLRSKLTAAYLYYIILPNADHIFVQSENMGAELVKKGFDKNKMTAVPMGVMMSEHPIETIQDDRLEGKLPVVYLGTMMRVRRIDFIIDAFALVAKSVPSAVLVLIGDGPANELKAIEQQIQSLGISDKVILTGFMSMEKAWKFVKASSVGISLLPPNYVMNVSSPTKVVEYMSLEVPVVVNDVGDQGELVRNSESGLVVDYNENDLSDAIKKIIEDKSLANQMGKNGKQYVELHRSYPVIAQNLEDKYLHLFGSSN